MEAPLRARTLRFKTTNNELIIKMITRKNKKVFNAALLSTLFCGVFSNDSGSNKVWEVPSSIPRCDLKSLF